MEEPTITNEDKENSPPEESGTVKKKIASLPEGKSYELLLMDIVGSWCSYSTARGNWENTGPKWLWISMQPQQGAGLT